MILNFFEKENMEFIYNSDEEEECDCNPYFIFCESSGDDLCKPYKDRIFYNGARQFISPSITKALRSCTEALTILSQHVNSETSKCCCERSLSDNTDSLLSYNIDNETCNCGKTYKDSSRIVEVADASSSSPNLDSSDQDFLSKEESEGFSEEPSRDFSNGSEFYVENTVNYEEEEEIQNVEGEAEEPVQNGNPINTTYKKSRPSEIGTGNFFEGNCLKKTRSTSVEMQKMCLPSLRHETYSEEPCQNEMDMGLAKNININVKVKVHKRKKKYSDSAISREKKKCKCKRKTHREIHKDSKKYCKCEISKPIVICNKMPESGMDFLHFFKYKHFDENIKDNSKRICLCGKSRKFKISESHRKNISSNKNDNKTSRDESNKPEFDKEHYLKNHHSAETLQDDMNTREKNNEKMDIHYSNNSGTKTEPFPAKSFSVKLSNGKMKTKSNIYTKSNIGDTINREPSTNLKTHTKSHLKSYSVKSYKEKPFSMSATHEKSNIGDAISGEASNDLKAPTKSHLRSYSIKPYKDKPQSISKIRGKSIIGDTITGEASSDLKSPTKSHLRSYSTKSYKEKPQSSGTIRGKSIIGETIGGEASSDLKTPTKSHLRSYSTKSYKDKPQFISTIRENSIVDDTISDESSSNLKAPTKSRLKSYSTKSYKDKPQSIATIRAKSIIDETVSGEAPSNLKTPTKSFLKSHSVKSYKEKPQFMSTIHAKSIMNDIDEDSESEESKDDYNINLQSERKFRDGEQISRKFTKSFKQFEELSPPGSKMNRSEKILNKNSSRIDKPSVLSSHRSELRDISRSKSSKPSSDSRNAEVEQNISIAENSENSADMVPLFFTEVPKHYQSSPFSLFSKEKRVNYLYQGHSHIVSYFKWYYRKDNQVSYLEVKPKFLQRIQSNQVQRNIFHKVIHEGTDVDNDAEINGKSNAVQCLKPNFNYQQVYDLREIFEKFEVYKQQQFVSEYAKMKQSFNLRVNKIEKLDKRRRRFKLGDENIRILEVFVVHCILLIYFVIFVWFTFFE
nr:uncharacterized protein LOC111504243 isoform X1 [Leptinotarsa decemlineata]